MTTKFKVNLTNKGSIVGSRTAQADIHDPDTLKAVEEIQREVLVLHKIGFVEHCKLEVEKEEE